MKNLKQITKSIFVVLFMVASSLFAQTTVGPFTYYPTNIGGTMQGQAQIDGVPALAGDIIAAFNPLGECVGAAELTIYGGDAYINFVIYGDDGGGHGMSSGEDFFIKLHQVSSGQTIEYGQALPDWTNTNFTPMPGYNNPMDVYNFIACEDAVAFAGPDIYICDNFAFAELDGLAENYSSILWTTSGDGFFEDATSLQTNYYPGFSDLQSGGAELCMLAEANTPCSPDGDCLDLYIQNSPLVYAGENALINETETFQLNATAEYYSTLTWSTNGDGTFFPTNTTATVYTPGANDILIGAAELCLIASPLYPCIFSEEDCLVLGIMQEITAPVVSTNTVSEITKTSALSGGEVISDGGDEVAERGVCWNTTGNPTTSDPHTSDEGGLGQFISNISGLSCQTTYYLRAYASNSQFTGYGDEIEFTTLPCGDQWFETVWTTPFQAMSIFVTKATIDDLNMVAGDEVGVFDIDPVSGNEICVGAGILTEELVDGAFLEIIASMDDGLGEANGFQPGNDMVFKLYSNDPEIGVVPDVTVFFPYEGYDEVFTPLGTAVVELEGFITQTINLSQGWNIISSRVVPQIPDMLDVFNPLIQDDVLIKVLDQDGNSVVHLPFPPPSGQWNNSIGEWENEQGYYVKVEQTTSLTMQGLSVSYPFEIPLRAGWNMISMPCSGTQMAQTMFQGLIDDGHLVKVINDAGQSIVHLPFPPPNGQWSFGFEYLEPGEGYYINVLEPTSLTYDCTTNDGDNSLTNVRMEPTEYFETVNKNNPYMPMTAAVSFANLDPDDEIAVFDGLVCVGAVKAGAGSFITFPLTADDTETPEQDGFIEEHPLIWKIWDKSTGMLYEDVQVEFMDGSLYFANLETFAGNIGDVLTGMSHDPIGKDARIEVSPNPVNEISTIQYYIPASGSVKIDLYEMNGRHISNLFSGLASRGEGSLTFTGSRYESGCYLLVLECESPRVVRVVEKVLIY